MRKIIVFSLLTISLYAGVVVGKVSLHDLTYVTDSTNTVCTTLPEEVKVKLFKGIKSGIIQPFKTVHQLGTMTELDVSLDNEDYHVITFSNISMCRMYQEVVLAGKYDDTIIKYINN